MRATRLSVIVPFALAAFALSCGGPPGWVDTLSWDGAPLETLRPPAGHDDAPALVVLDEGSMEIYGGGELGFSVFDRHRVVRIFDPRGHRYANVMIPYGSGSTVSDIQARAIAPDGTISLLKPEDIYDVSLYPNFVFFSDQRARIFTLPGVQNGSVVEYRYRVQVHNRTFWHSWSFQDEIPVLRSRFTLVKPGEWEVRSRTYGIDVEPAVVGAPAGFKSKHVWEARNLPPFQSEFGMPPAHERLGRLALAPVGYTSWADVGSWYADVVAPRIRSGPRMRALADSLVSASQHPHRQLQSIFEWVRDNIRYIAVEIGVGGYQPHFAEEVLEKRYGDCKDMVVLLCALAREAGITVHPVLISTLDNGRPDTLLPSPLQFNHLIAFAPGIGPNGTWMDATDKACRFGTLPWYDQGLPVIIAEPKGTRAIAITPKADPAAHAHTLEWEITLSPDSPGVVGGSSMLTGAVAVELRHELRAADAADRKAWMQNYLSKRVPAAILDTFAIEGLQPSGDSVFVTYRFHSHALGMRQDSTFIFRPGDIVGTTLADYFRSQTRIHPVRFRFGSRAALSALVTLPDGWVSASTPCRDTISSPFGSWALTVSTQESPLTVKTGYRLNGEDILPPRYPEFRSFLDSVRVRDTREIIFRRTPRQ